VTEEVKFTEPYLQIAVSLAVKVMVG